MLGIFLNKIGKFNSDSLNQSITPTDFRILLQPTDVISPESLRQFEPDHNVFALTLALKCLESSATPCQECISESINLELSLRMINEELSQLSERPPI